MELKKGSHLSTSITTASTHRRLCLHLRERFCARESAGKHRLTINPHPAQRQNKVAGAHITFSDPKANSASVPAKASILTVTRHLQLCHQRPCYLSGQGGLNVREVRFDLSGSESSPARCPAVRTTVYPVRRF